ncbi:Gfo/Idh/MocA family protein [Zhouia amylolytica]|nr:Gfo/Idh/MocA family oxidoreductase [Zhouia amylolytica]
MILKKLVPLLLSIFISSQLLSQNKAVSIGVVGLTHSHVQWIFDSEKMGTIKIVGIVEPNRELAERYARLNNFPISMVYRTMEEMIEATKPEAVCAFGTIYDHLEVVEKAAPRGIHVMVEKPLAVSLDHAQRMQSLAKKHRIHLLTNYETTWYPTNHKAMEFLRKDSIGAIRKVVIRDGHKGPKKIGVNKEFLEWLTDPKENGGGAITDFGCYGVNLMTWLMQGEIPLTVTAVTQQLQPENNPKVDDDATILLNYAKANATIQASWNWPIGRKDMEIYGLTGVIYADNRHNLRMRIAEGYDGYQERSYELAENEAPMNDPFSYFAAVIRNEITLEPYDPSSLENNMIVMKILDAAIKSSKTNRAIELEKR